MYAIRSYYDLADVIDPLGGSYYMESLTDAMEQEIADVIAQIDAAGGMYQAVEKGLVQSRIGESALAFQEQVESGAQKVVGVNAYTVADEAIEHAPIARPDTAVVENQLKRLQAFKAARSQRQVQTALDRLV